MTKAQGTLSFEDVAVGFTWEEWQLLDLSQKDLYKDVMLENYNNLVSVGYQGTKPDSVFKLEQGETPWIVEGGIHSGTSPEEIWAIDHMQRHPENQNELKSLERCLQNFTLGDNFGLRKNLAFLTQRHNTFDSHCRSLQSHLDFVIQNKRDIGKDSDEFSGYGKSSVHMKHDNTFPGIKYHGCVKPSSAKSQLSGHPKTYTEEQPHKCSECGKVFSKRPLLLYHQRIHTGDKPYVCSECGKAFTWESRLKRHQRSHIGEKLYGCNECGKSFSQKAYLIVHQRLHTGEKPHECSDCRRTFAFKSALTKHQRIHTGERPYECSECEKAYRCKSELIQHQRTHNRERPYECSECKRTFLFEAALTNHQRIHTGERPYECSECEKAFRSKYKLMQHKQTHTRGRPYGCSECGKSFTHMSFLIKHKKTHSKEKVINSLKVGRPSSGSHSTLYKSELIQK
ncbi:zinc finger protein 613-like [Trichechus manatus latirostris]|uniref:Zinc finger protein 613-like n=1 Tax=Trichechus manatus latirostris TaxID=127582 RepID=A0A2Y9RA44_TRIMA|nr:zinc finger protein 613-like [Trichechus manatus latirostris]